ncbi:replication protein [Pseudomonas sp. FSL R10-0765]|uniref:replication protein n=1 Tax=Pseudomonas sp. FSL R10-0765 TaxID=2662195 RepID=UPI001297243C|nr:replication protein [Pseudomonas sp. FSL R10-0765]MQT44257.1 replication protein [Pseudomonas sp. FSL R10-0765]
MTDKKIETVSRRGLPRYSENPSVVSAASNSKTGVKRISNKAGDRFMVISEHGEVMAPVGFHQVVPVDKTQFVKLYANGVKAFQGLSAAGAKVFELIYSIVQGTPGTDRFYLHFMSVDEHDLAISYRTFHRGLGELLKKEFVFESITPNLYFLNVDYLFNGNRMAFIKEYRLIDTLDDPKTSG